MATKRTRLFVLTILILGALLSPACTRSASTPPATEEADTSGGAQSETEATMDAVRSAILTQTAQADAGSAGPGQPTYTPTPGITDTPSILLVSATPTASGAFIEYTVKPGDWIWQIARNFGVDPQEIIDANNLADPASISPGMVLLIPTGETGVIATRTPETASGTPTGSETPSGAVVIHVVKPGEWIWSIARIYGVDPQAIIDANNLTDPASISVGQELIIP
jgi:LysM repeat protein